MQYSLCYYDLIILITSFSLFLSLETTFDPIQTLKDSKGKMSQRIQKSESFSVDDNEEEKIRCNLKEAVPYQITRILLS